MLAWLWAFIIFVLAPTAGVAWYVAVLNRMKREGVPEPPEGSFFLVFAAYGLILLFVLTLLVGRWSGMHSLGIVALVLFIGPTLAVQAAVLWSRRRLSRYHAAAFALSAAFYPAFAASLVVPGAIMAWLS